MRTACLAAVLLALCSTPVARAQVQAKVSGVLEDTNRVDHGATLAGAEPLVLADSFDLNGCAARAEAITGLALGFPVEGGGIDAGVEASNTCGEMQSASDGMLDADVLAVGVLVYRVSGGDAVAPPFPAILVEKLTGSLSTTKGTTDDVFFTSDVSIVPSPLEGSPYSVNASLQDDFAGTLFTPSADLATAFVDQSTATESIFALDTPLVKELSLPSYVVYLRFQLRCFAEVDWIRFGPRAAASPRCNFYPPLGPSNIAQLESSAPGVVFDQVVAIEPTRPDSSVMISPETGQTENFPGSAAIPSVASGSGDLGQGASGGSNASGDLPVVDAELVANASAESHIDQSAVTASAGATVASEGRGAASLRYHATFLNGFTGPFNVAVRYPAVDATLSATRGLDPSIVERASLELDLAVQGVPLFHFATLSLGSSDQDPPGQSGDLGRSFECIDHSTSTTQTCTISDIPDDTIGVIADHDDDIVLTEQADCATRLTYGPGALPLAHLGCDASHAVTVKLLSKDPNVVLTPVPEPESRALALAAASALGALATRRKGAKAGF